MYPPNMSLYPNVTTIYTRRTTRKRYTSTTPSPRSTQSTFTRPNTKILTISSKRILTNNTLSYLLETVDKPQPERAGVIPYLIQDGVMWFALGIDEKSGDLTDFSGSVKYYENENAVHGAFREFAEESLEVFADYYSSDTAYPLIYNEKDLIIFVPVSCDKSSIKERFAALVEDHPRPEVSSIVWVCKQEFLAVIEKEGRMYHRLRKFLFWSREILWTILQSTIT